MCVKRTILRCFSFDGNPYAKIMEASFSAKVFSSTAYRKRPSGTTIQMLRFHVRSDVFVLDNRKLTCIFKGCFLLCTIKLEV